MDKMDGMTMNIEQANVEKLKEVFPEVFMGGKVDFDKLQGLLGHYIADDILQTIKKSTAFPGRGRRTVCALHKREARERSVLVSKKARIGTRRKTSISRAIIWKC